jgi:hypothetical protein
MKKAFLYSVARSQQELQEAQSLIFRQYCKEGYIAEWEMKEREAELASVLSMPSATTLVCRFDDRVAGTVTVIEDSSRGLPMDALFCEELADFRTSGKKLAEVGRFAIDQDIVLPEVAAKKRPYLSLLLLKLVFGFLSFRAIDYCCISVNPKHSDFYDSLFFENIGEVKSYALVNNAPAVPKVLRINEKFYERAKAHLLLGEFFRNPVDPEVFDREKSAVVRWELE